MNLLGVINIQKIKNYKGIIKCALNYLRDLGPGKGATSEEILEYMENNGLLGYKMDTIKLGRILGDSKMFNQTKRYSSRCKQDKIHWTIKN